MSSEPHFFRGDARVMHGERELSLTLAEQTALLIGSQRFHGPGDPSTWLCAAVLGAARSKHGDAPETALVDLAALALGVDRAKFLQRVRWHENYMRWHDGEPYSVLDESIIE